MLQTDGGRNIAAARTTYAAIIAYSISAEKATFLVVSRNWVVGVASGSRAGKPAGSGPASRYLSASLNRAISEWFVIESQEQSKVQSLCCQWLTSPISGSRMVLGRV